MSFKIHAQTIYGNKYKPDGLDIIDHTNVLEVYKRVSLLDLNGINTRYLNQST